MNKYFLVRPSEFYQYDDVDIDGNYAHVKIEDFVVSEKEDLNSKFNYFMFEVPCKENGKSIRYANQATELFSKSKFDVSVLRNPQTNEDVVMIKSEELGLYLEQPVLLKDIETKPSKVSGLCEYMKEDQDLFREYSFCLDTTLEAAYFNRVRHDETLYGPSNKSKRQLRRSFAVNRKY